MHTFIDESGTFGLAPASDHSFACVTGTVVPTAHLDELFSNFSRLSFSWPKEKGEVKGKLLNEDQFDAALRLFQRHNVRIQTVACDMTMHSESDISMHQREREQKLINAANSNVSAELRNQLLLLAQAMPKLSIPEYVQMCMMNELVHEIQRRQILWAALNDPPDLSSFHWEIDPKDEKRTKMEELWNELLKPSLEFRSISEPMIYLEEANYSYLPADLVVPVEERVLSHLQDVENVDGYDLSILMRNISFPDSRQSIGIQIADIAASCVRRALSGRLRQAGWRRLPNLMVRPLPPNHDLIKLVTLGEPANRGSMRTHISYLVMEKMFVHAPKWPWQKHKTFKPNPGLKG